MQSHCLQKPGKVLTMGALRVTQRLTHMSFLARPVGYTCRPTGQWHKLSGQPASRFVFPVVKVFNLDTPDIRMANCLWLTFLCVGLYMSGDAAVMLTPVIETTHGPIQGEVLTFDGTTIHRYRGIPYAAPPVGELRFAPPRAPEPWTQPLRATEYGSRCMTGTVLDKKYYYPPRQPPAMSEDCLYLNVAVPQSTQDNL